MTGGHSAGCRREQPPQRTTWWTVECGRSTSSASRSCGAPASPARQRLIDVGGHRLNIRRAVSSSPTVVREPGLGESASAMARWIAPDVARTTTICVYGRAGHGRSDRAEQAEAARDLHVLLDRAHVPGPNVLAGHSLGGMFALSYTHRYPAQVGGVVLLDSMHPAPTERLRRHGPAAGARPNWRAPGSPTSSSTPRTASPPRRRASFVRDVTDMPLIDDKTHAAQSSRAIREIVKALQKDRV